MSISQDDIQKVRDASDIVEIVGEQTPLKQRGHEFWGCCPFHNEKTPSFKVDSSTQLWHCFGCGEGGDIFGFIMKRDELNFPEAIRFLADKAHIDIVETGKKNSISQSKKQRLKSLCEASAQFFHTQLMRGQGDDLKVARSYLSSRNLGGSTPKEWMLGYSRGRNSLFNHLSKLGYTPQEMVEANVVVSREGRYHDRFYDRVMFPIFDISGECIAFGGRIIGDGQPKYLNSGDTPIFHKSNVLYGLNKAKAEMAATGVAIVAEGYTDVIALHNAGFKNAIATLGTALTKNHIRQLSRHAKNKIIYLFDGDEAGQRATERALQFIDSSITPEAGKSRIDICALTLPENLDPAEYIDKYGAEKMRERLEEAMPLLAFGIERRLAKYDIDSVEDKAYALRDALELLAPIKDSILAKEYAIQIAGKLHLRENDVLDELAKFQVRMPYASENNTNSDIAAKQNSTNENMKLSIEDRNRMRLERELLALCTQNPVKAISQCDNLLGISWHSNDHSDIATSIVATLTTNLSASPAEIISNAEKVVPGASSILTYSQTDGNADEQLGRIVDELQLGDMQAQVRSIKEKLSKRPDEQSSKLFEDVVNLQNEIIRRRENLKNS